LEAGREKWRDTVNGSNEACVKVTEVLYRVCAVIFDGVGAVLKFCTMIVETLNEF
jgi:hypothetical protein